MSRSKDLAVCVAIPWLLQGNRTPEAPVKIWARSDGRIAGYDPFELVFLPGANRPAPGSRSRILEPAVLEPPRRLPLLCDTPRRRLRSAYKNCACMGSRV
jgi:hypothetical protein